MEAQIARFKPDVIGISIRIVTGDTLDESAVFNTRHFDYRSRVKEMVNRIKRISGAHIVLGGPGFNV